MFPTDKVKNARWNPKPAKPSEIHIRPADGKHEEQLCSITKSDLYFSYNEVGIYERPQYPLQPFLLFAVHFLQLAFKLTSMQRTSLRNTEFIRSSSKFRPSLIWKSLSSKEKLKKGHRTFIVGKKVKSRKNLPLEIEGELSSSLEWDTGTTTPREKSMSSIGVQKYVVLTSFIVTPSFSVPPRGKNRFATYVFEPPILLRGQKNIMRVKLKNPRVLSDWPPVSLFTVKFLKSVRNKRKSKPLSHSWKLERYTPNPCTRNYKIKSCSLVIDWLRDSFRSCELCCG